MLYSGQPFASPQEALAHHGVKGMKWGVRKDRGGSSGDVGSGEAAPLIAIGAIYAGLVLAALVSKTKDSGKFNQLKTRRTPFKTDASLTKKMSIEDLHSKVVKPINSNFGARGTKMNCRRCTFAYEMRRRGLDVNATTSDYATGQTIHGVQSATKSLIKNPQSIWGHTQISSPSALSKMSTEAKASSIFSALAKNPSNSRGELGVGWNMGGGHSMAWEVVNGKPVIFDTQNSRIYRDSKALSKWEFMSVTHDAAFSRLDNLDLDHDFLRKWVKNA